MFQPEAESDEDNEVYFLKPVNEYNIVEKIKEANKQLFAELEGSNYMDSGDAHFVDDKKEALLLAKDSTTLDSSNSNSNLNLNRKVTFAEVLENYCPEDSNIPNPDEDDLENNNEKVVSENLKEKSVKQTDYIKERNTFKKKTTFPKIEEETEDLEYNLLKNNQEMSDKKQENENENKNINEEEIELGEVPDEEVGLSELQTGEGNSSSLATSFLDTKTAGLINTPDEEDPIMEEIYEEIQILDIEHESQQKQRQAQLSTFSTFSSSSSPSFSNSSQPLQRRNTIIKQETFDYFDDQDNKSLTNLLPNSEDEDEEVFKALKKNYLNDNCDSSEDVLNRLLNNSNFTDDELDESVGKNKTENINNNYNSNEDKDNDDDDDDEDDDLSIIVASYIPDDFHYSSLNRKNKNKISSASTSSLNKRSNSNKNNPKKRSNFSKHFSFRRKAISTNSIGTTPICWRQRNNTCPSNSVYGDTENDENDQSDPYDIKNLKLNYKTCCEYRNATFEKLPKYTGYLSEYGLSQEQLKERNQKLKKKQTSLLQQTLKTQENELRKMEDNERAFTTWLKNKMRFPINKTRNMFDINKNRNRDTNNKKGKSN